VLSVPVDEGEPRAGLLVGEYQVVPWMQRREVPFPSGEQRRDDQQLAGDEYCDDGSYGVLLMVRLARRCRPTTSQTGSPVIPSATGAHPVTL
jgi:hypothetical protein